MSAALHAAIARLAALFPYGELQASTEPAAFLHAVAEELERLRGNYALATAPVMLKFDPQRDAALEVLRPFARKAEEYKLAREMGGSRADVAMVDLRDLLAALEFWQSHRQEEP